MITNSPLIITNHPLIHNLTADNWPIRRANVAALSAIQPIRIQKFFWLFCDSAAGGRDLFLHQKIFFLHQTGPAGFSRFCTKIIFFSHQLGFFPAPKQFFSAPNDFGNCIWFCTKLILFLHQNDTKSLEAGTKLFWFCTKYFLDFFWFSTKYIPILHQFVTN